MQHRELDWLKLRAFWFRCHGCHATAHTSEMSHCLSAPAHVLENVATLKVMPLPPSWCEFSWSACGHNNRLNTFSLQIYVSGIHWASTQHMALSDVQRWKAVHPRTKSGCVGQRPEHEWSWTQHTLSVLSVVPDLTHLFPRSSFRWIPKLLPLHLHQHHVEVRDKARICSLLEVNCDLCPVRAWQVEAGEDGNHDEENDVPLLAVVC